MLIFFFFLRKKRGKKKKSIAECPKDHTGRQDAELLASTAPRAPSARPGGSVADTAHARPVSAQMGRWEKSLFDEASEGW